MSGREGFFAFVAAGMAFAVAPEPDALPAHAACAHRSPARAISSPGFTGEAQSPQVVAYLAVIGTGSI
jgi:hypothetical protein